MRKIGIIVGILLITMGCATQQERAEERAKTKMLVQEAIAATAASAIIQYFFMAVRAL